MDPLAKRVVRRFLASQGQQVAEDVQGGAGCETAGEGCTAVAPEGWEGPIKEMKKDPEVENPWALAWHMKEKGYEPHK